MGATELDHPDWIGWDHANEHGLDPASDSLLAAFSDAAKMQCLRPILIGSQHCRCSSKHPRSYFFVLFARTLQWMIKRKI
jgi:hypothetical protein